MCYEVIIACFRALCRNLPGVTEEHHEKIRKISTAMKITVYIILKS
jgi:hypothetical protein